MADEHQRRTHRAKPFLQPFDDLNVEVVRRFVQQKHVRVRRERLGQGRTPSLSAGKSRRRFLPREAQFTEKQTSLIRVVARPEAALDIGQHRLVLAKIRLLRKVARGDAGLDETRSAIRLDEPRRNLHQRRFAGAVAPDNADAIRFGHGEIRVFEKRGSAESQRNVLKCEEWSRHDPGREYCLR